MKGPMSSPSPGIGQLLLFYSMLLIAGKLLLWGSLLMGRRIIGFSIFVPLL